jgi:leucyl/phenylalanyl-tRNA---protein transferase
MAARPVEPPPTSWHFPPVDAADEDGLVGVGADLEPGTLLAAYRTGLFPMPAGRDGPMGWWSPDPRGVLPLDELRVSRSLRRSTHRYEVRVDTRFEAVMRACGDPRRSGGWITEPMVAAYVRMHELGWVHSVETWSDEGELVGGLYGIAIGGFFAGESMFSRAVDASKVALVDLVDRLRGAGYRLLDVQWATPHLRTLGVIEIPRPRYVVALEEAREGEVTDAW